MKKEERIIFYDNDLKIEAYKFSSIRQKFPEHFHEHYAIGTVEHGHCIFTCNQKEYSLKEQEALILNPLDIHSCIPSPEITFVYCCLNLSREVMRNIVIELTGSDKLPIFPCPSISNANLAQMIAQLYLLVATKEDALKKEELFFFFMEHLLKESALQSHPKNLASKNKIIDKTCDYIENNYANTLTLDKLAQLANLSKYHFLRSFVKNKGLSPYRYLETIRINKAKKLLQQQVALNQIAVQTGFTDQSHFTNSFKERIGLPPGQYMKIFREENN